MQFADGRKATNLDAEPSPESQEPDRPLLIEGQRNGGGSVWDMEYVVRPLPRSGPSAFVCVRPGRCIPESRAEIDAGLILEAAGCGALLASRLAEPAPPSQSPACGGRPRPAREQTRACRSRLRRSGMKQSELSVRFSLRTRNCPKSSTQFRAAVNAGGTFLEENAVPCWRTSCEVEG